MRESDRHFAQVRAALERVATVDASELVAEARADARAQVRSILSDAFADVILEQVLGELGDGARTEAPRPSEARSGESALYLHGVIHSSDVPATTAVPGLDGQSVEPVIEGHLAAVTSRVAREDFDEAQLRANLSDMAWVETIARAHEGALDELCTRATVIPMRMCTVFRTERQVREMLAREASQFGEALERLAAKREWGVQAFADPARARLSDAESFGSPDEGAAYMQRRREERDLRQQHDQLVEQAANEVHERLSAITVESILNPPQRPEASGRSGQMVLNGVYLVADDAQESFQHEVRALQDELAATGLELVITGPWPPYNFVTESIGAGW